MTRRGKGGGAAKPAAPSAAQRSRLAVLVDGAPLGDEEARALWERFSAHMDAHQGDIAGFAAASGYASAAPEYRHGQAVLVLTSRRA